MLLNNLRVYAAQALLQELSESRGMNIGIVVSYTPDVRIGGAQVQAWELARRLAARHTVTLFTRRLRQMPAREERDGVDLVGTAVLPLPGLRMLSHIVFSAAAVLRQRPRPDVLLCFTTRPGGIIGLLARTFAGIPFCTSIRGGDWYFPRSTLAGRMMLRWVLPRSNRVIVQAGRIGGEVREMFPGVSPEVIPNGIEVSPGEEQARGERLLFVGNLLARKGLHVLLDALRQCRQVPLLIVGDGPERRRLQGLCEGLDVEFRGAIRPQQVRDLMKAEGKALVLPAVAGEGFPNVLMEAMAAGLPVVATDVAGIRDLLEDGQAGTIVPAGDATALASAIRALWEDEGARRRLAAAGRQAIARYDWHTVLPRYEEILSSVVRGERA